MALDPRHALGQLMRQLRHQRGLTVRDLARAASISIGTVSHIECGKHVCSLSTLDVLLAILDADAEQQTLARRLHAQALARRDPNGPREPAELFRAITELARARYAAWQRGDAELARQLERDSERLWRLYRVAVVRWRVDHGAH